MKSTYEKVAETLRDVANAITGAVASAKNPFPGPCGQ